jgi:hypothetical protein
MKLAKLQFVNEKQICANNEKIQVRRQKKVTKGKFKKKKEHKWHSTFTYLRQTKKYGNANLNKGWGLLVTLIKLRSPYVDSIS